MGHSVKMVRKGAGVVKERPYSKPSRLFRKSKNKKTISYCTHIYFLSVTIASHEYNKTIFKAIFTSPNHGYAKASSTYGQAFGPVAAFDGDDDSYWSSAKNPSKPVHLWFSFKEKQNITKIAVKEHTNFKGQSYQVYK